MKLRSFGLALAVIVVLWLVIPTKDIVSPDWDVLVTDMQDQPISGARVTDHSQQYTIEQRDIEEDATTGADGRVHFHQRTVWATGFRRLLGALGQLQYGPHGSFGVHTFVAAYKVGYADPMEVADFAQNERESRANGLAYQSSHPATAEMRTRVWRNRLLLSRRH